MKKIRDLCSSLSKMSRVHSPLDQVATKIFQQTEVQEYTHSRIPPEPIYQINIDQDALHHHNDYLEIFDQCGPNEKYLLNKIFFSPYYLLYIVGGIGVGKTTFSHYLINHLLPTVRHQEVNDASRCPTAIYFNFLKEGRISVGNKSLEEIEGEFFNLLCNRIEGEIGARGYFDLTEEVESVWEKILKAKDFQFNPALSYLLKRLHEEEAKNLPSDYDLRLDIIKRRKEIRSELIKNKEYRGHYLAQLLRYIRDEYYKDHNYCFLLIIDNIDRESPFVQKAVSLAIKPFANNSEIRVVINARQTTFYQGQGDNLSEAVDWVGYCGPSPLEILNARLNNFLQSPQDFEKFYAPADLPFLAKGISEIKDNFLKQDRFTSFFQSFCGRSIRKGLIIAQNLIFNSLYDPYEVGKIGVLASRLSLSDILRALIIGSGDAYSYNADDIIENIFQVQKQKTESSLIKLRILHILLRSSDGVMLNYLFNLLKCFNYSAELIEDAINEMMYKSKRLIWSDSVREFESVEELMSLGKSRLFISTIGKGYAMNLCKKIEYMQEVMLDTSIAPEYLSHFGSGWDYGKMEERLKLVSRFCSLLVIQDIEDVKAFIIKCGAKQYKKAFGFGGLISKEILESITQDVGHILSYVIDHAQGISKTSRKEFKEEYMTYCNDWILRAEEVEKTLLEIENRI